MSKTNYLGVRCRQCWEEDQKVSAVAYEDAEEGKFVCDEGHEAQDIQVLAIPEEQIFAVMPPEPLVGVGVPVEAVQPPPELPGSVKQAQRQAEETIDTRWQGVPAVVIGEFEKTASDSVQPSKEEARLRQQIHDDHELLEMIPDAPPKIVGVMRQLESGDGLISTRIGEIHLAGLRAEAENRGIPVEKYWQELIDSALEGGWFGTVAVTARPGTARP